VSQAYFGDAKDSALCSVACGLESGLAFHRAEYPNEISRISRRSREVDCLAMATRHRHTSRVQVKEGARAMS
jgi:hypothetical protein